MDAELNGATKPVVSEKKRQSSNNEPPVLSRCEDPVELDDDRQVDPCSSPPALSRETYVTRKRSSDVKALSTVYKLNLRNDRSRRRNGANYGFGKVALRLLNTREKRKQRKQMQKKQNARLAPIKATAGRTTRSRAAAFPVSPLGSCENSVSSVDVQVTASTGRILRSRKSDLSSSAPIVEPVKAKSSPVHVPKELSVKEKHNPEEVDFVDGIEILGFSSLVDLQKYTEAQEALQGPVHVSDEEIDVEYFSDMEDDPTSSSMIASNTFNSFSMSDSSRMSLFDSSDGEADRSASRNDDEAWNMKDLATDEASCSSSKLTTSGRHSKTIEKSEMPKVGQVVDLGLGRPLRPETARNIHQLLDQSGTISRKVAEFSASVVSQKGKQAPKARLVLPVVCPKMIDIMRYKWAVGDHGEQVTLSTAKTKRSVPKPGTSASSESNPFQLKKTLPEPGTSQSAERPKRKSEAAGGRLLKKTRKSREATATKVAEDKLDSDIEVVEVKKSSVVTKDEDVRPTEISVSTLKAEPVVTKLEKPPKEVEDIVREMLDFVTLRNEVRIIPFDPDQSEGHEEEEKSAPPTKVPVQKKRGAGLLCELRRLDVTVFDMDEKTAEELPPLDSTSTEENCKKDMCRLGCLCESLAGRRATMPTHCGRVDCMFECSCTSICYERRTEGRHLLDVSDATLAWIQDESERNLAKVERQFKQTVVRAKDDLIVMGSKRSRRAIKLPERYREDYFTQKDNYPLFEVQKSQKKPVTTSTPPLTPTNKSISPSKLITPPKVQSNMPNLPQRPKFNDPPENPPAKVKKMPARIAAPESSYFDTKSEDENSFTPEVRPCSVLLYRNATKQHLPPRRNIALKSTSKVRHTHNIVQSSARTSSNFTESHRVSKRNENKLTSLWNQHSADNEIFCHIVKEHSISPEEWERSGELAASNEPLSPLKKSPNSVQLIPWSFLRDKFKNGEYHIWYKCKQDSTKQKLYLTDGPTKPNKACIDLRELDESLFKGLPSMIAKLVIKTENADDDDKDARCFIKSIGDFWMIAGYMQRTSGSTPDTTGFTVTTTPSLSKTSEDEVVEIDDPKFALQSGKSRIKAQARWWLLHLTKTFDMLVFTELGVRVKFSQIKKTATLANNNKDRSDTFIRMSLQKNSKFGLYGIPGMPDCVLIGPYGLDQTPGFMAYTQISSKANRYVRVPIYCANKNSEYELEGRKTALSDSLLRVPNRVIGTWLYDFKSLEIPRPVADKHEERSSSEDNSEKKSYFSPELRSRLEEQPELRSKLEEQCQPELANLPVSVTTPPGRVKVRAGQSLLKGNDEVKTINKNTLSVKIDGKSTEAVVHVGEDVEIKSQDSDGSKRGTLKIRQDLMKAPTTPPPKVPQTPTTNMSSSRRSSTDQVVDIDDGYEEEARADPMPSAQANEKVDPKRDYIISNIQNLGYIPVTYIDDNSLFIPHFGVPGQVRLFKTHDEVVKYVYQNVRQKITFIGFRPETICWRQVDSLDDMKGEKQFNPGILAGNHVITKAGLINLVKLTEEEIPSLNLMPKEAEDLAGKLDHIKSLPLLRQLGRLLVGPKAGPMPLNAIVVLAESEIQKLAAQGIVLKNKRKELVSKQYKLEAQLKNVIKDLPEEQRLRAQKEFDSVRIEKPVIVLDEDSDDDEEAVSASACDPAPRKEFAVSEMVNLSSDEECVEGVVSKSAVERPTAIQTTISKLPSSTIVTSEAITIPCSTATSSITNSATNRQSQSLICKFPFSPLKRVNVTVKEDGIVSTPSTNSTIQINQPVRTLSRSSDGSLVKAIKIVDSNSLKQFPPSQPRIIQTQPRVGASIIRPPLPTATGVVQQKIPILRAMPRATISSNSDVRRTVLMTRGSTTVPMTVVRQKSGEPFMKIVTQNSDKVFFTSSHPVVKTVTDLKTAGLKILHPNIQSNQRLSSPPKPSFFRIIKPLPSTATADNGVKVLVSPQKVVPLSVPTTSPASGIAEIDTTELVID